MPVSAEGPTATPKPNQIGKVCICEIATHVHVNIRFPVGKTHATRANHAAITSYALICKAKVESSPPAPASTLAEAMLT